MTTPSFLWHDFETFGADPRRDRPAQFAAIRTNELLEPVEEPIVIYCQPARDMLPHPMACLITGISPQLARERGVPENAFAARIHEEMSRPDTCTVGFNNFRFDDEVTRHLFWRNFFDPYSREYANGNSRFDLIDLLRMARALRPDGINWPDRQDGTPSFRLEHLAEANGIDNSRAHDALADVEATIALARLLRARQPRLWDWALSLRHKHVVAAMLQKREALLHTSARFPASQLCTAPVLPVAPHPTFAGQWIVWNLNIDPTPFFDLEQEELIDRMWTNASELPPGVERLPVKLVRANRCPMLSPLSTLDRAASARLAINPNALAAHVAALHDQREFADRLSALFNNAASYGSGPVDPELALYDGFVPRSDQQIYPRLRELGESDLSRLGTPFTDERLNTLLFRYRARLFPDSLDHAENERWQRDCRRRLMSDPDLASIRWDEYQALVAELMSKHPDKLPLLEQLAQWPMELGLISGSKINFQ